MTLSIMKETQRETCKLKEQKCQADTITPYLFLRIPLFLKSQRVDLLGLIGGNSNSNSSLLLTSSPRIQTLSSAPTQALSNKGNESPFS